MNYLAEQIPGQQISIEQISYYYFKNNLLNWHLSVWDFFKHLGVLYGIWFYTILNKGYAEIATEFMINRKLQILSPNQFYQMIQHNTSIKKLRIDAVSLFHALFKFPGDDRLI